MKLSQYIFKKNKTHNHIQIQWTFIFIRLIHLKNRNKVNTIKWRPIKAYFMDSRLFSDDFMQKCKDNANDAQFIPLEMENNINLMSL